jgi:hypothetical protein
MIRMKNEKSVFIREIRVLSFFAFDSDPIRA